MNKIFHLIALALLANLVVYSQTPPSAGTYISASGPPCTPTCCLPNSIILTSTLSTSAATTGVTVLFAPFLTTATVCGNAANNPSSPPTSITPVNSGATYTFTSWTTGPIITPINSTAFTITPPSGSTGCTAVTYVPPQVPQSGAYMLSPNFQGNAASCCYPQTVIMPSVSTSGTTSGITLNMPSGASSSTNCGSGNGGTPPTSMSTTNNGASFTLGSFGNNGPQIVSGNLPNSFSIQPAQGATGCPPGNYQAVAPPAAGIYQPGTSSTNLANCCIPSTITFPSALSTTGATTVTMTMGSGASTSTCGNNNPSPAPTSITTSNNGLTFTLGAWGTSGPQITPASPTTFTIQAPTASTGCTSPITFTRNDALSGPMPPGPGTYVSTSGPQSSATCCLPNSITLPPSISTSAATSGVTMNFAPSLTTATVCGNAANNPSSPPTSITPVSNGATYTFTSWTTGPIITPINNTAFTITPPSGSTGCTSPITYAPPQLPQGGAFMLSPNFQGNAATCCYPQSIVMPNGISTSGTTNGITMNMPQGASSSTNCGSGSGGTPPTSISTSNNGGSFTLGSFGNNGPQLVAGNSQSSFTIQPAQSATNCPTASYIPVQPPVAGTYTTTSSTTQANCCIPSSITFSSALSTNSQTPSISITMGSGASTNACGGNDPTTPPTSVTSSNSGATFTLGSWGNNGPQINPVTQTSFTIQPPSGSTGCTSPITYTRSSSSAPIPPGAGTYVSTNGAQSSSNCCLPTSITMPSSISTSNPTNGVTMNFSPQLTASACGNAANNPSTPPTGLTPTNNGASYSFSSWTGGPTITPGSGNSFTITPPSGSGCTGSVTYSPAQPPQSGAYMLSPNFQGNASTCCYPQTLYMPSVSSNGLTSGISMNMPSGASSSTNCGSGNGGSPPTSMSSSNNGGTFTLGSFGNNGPQLVAGGSQNSFSIQPAQGASNCPTASYVPIQTPAAGTYTASSTQVNQQNCCLPTTITIPSNVSTNGQTNNITMTMGTGASQAACGGNNPTTLPTSLITSTSGASFTIGSWGNTGPQITPLSTSQFTVQAPSSSTGCTTAVTYTRNGVISGPILLALSSIIAIFYSLLIQLFRY